jgi:hypothetical protein
MHANRPARHVKKVPFCCEQTTNQVRVIEYKAVRKESARAACYHRKRQTAAEKGIESRSALRARRLTAHAVEREGGISHKTADSF